MKNEVAQPNGLTICYFGDGKGKTTAALGLALRAAGQKKKTLIVQFIKGDWESGEDIACAQTKQIRIVKMGKGFVGLGNKTDIKVHIESAQKALEFSRRAMKKDFDILVLDEILGAVKGSLIKTKDIIELIKIKPVKMTLVLTGQPKIIEVIKICDLVTQMKKVKHPYDNGILAIKGIDY